jgi:hypothetical protein
MKYNLDLHHRHSIRLQNYDYADTGAYFITMCCQNRVNRFGEIVNNINNVGAGSCLPHYEPRFTNATWQNTPTMAANGTIWATLANGAYAIRPYSNNNGGRCNRRQIPLGQ